MSDAGATLTLSGIRDRLASYRPEAAGSGGDAHAAVALVLQSGSQGPEFVAIHRSHRAGDRKSVV